MTSDVSFEENATGPFVRLKLRGGKTCMLNTKNKNDRIITPINSESCLYALTQRCQLEIFFIMIIVIQL